MPIRVWSAGEHEVAETVLRYEHRPGDIVTLEDPPVGSSRWRVLSARKDPHGWRTTATRCLPGCREHSLARPGEGQPCT
ncbi:MAG TPA: hypothetical protein VKG01_02930 [Thermoanaerobaculia bacterium]|nr:hypothetical protein [Thermoanaerobaculia bacterium]